MNEIMIEISSYLIIAIMLGYIFGWLVTKASRKERFIKNSIRVDKEELNKLTQKLIKCQSNHTALLSENNKILLENREQKLQLHQINKKLIERDLLIKDKNNTIKTLNQTVEEQKDNLKQKLQEYESEIEAFVNERRKTLEKFKTL
jgi:small-conductance mechanosensitive channel